MDERVTGNLTCNFGSYKENKVTFWALCTVYFCFGLIAAVGNGLVLYASFGTRSFGHLKHLGGAIKSLAATDMLLGLVGVPGRIIGMRYLGMHKGQMNYKDTHLVTYLGLI